MKKKKKKKKQENMHDPPPLVMTSCGTRPAAGAAAAAGPPPRPGPASPESDTDAEAASEMGSEHWEEAEEEAGPYLTGTQPELIRGAARAQDSEAAEAEEVEAEAEAEARGQSDAALRQSSAAIKPGSEEEEAGPYLTGAQPELIRGAARAQDSEAAKEAEEVEAEAEAEARGQSDAALRQSSAAIKPRIIRVSFEQRGSGVKSQGSIVVGVAYDCQENHVYWSDLSGRTISRASLTPGAEPEILINTDLTSPEGLAVDPTRRLMFWVDSAPDKIERARLDGSERRTLFHTQLVNPRAIIVVPSTGGPP
ncbi:hypothetical protein CRUP_010014 [Coryphaenoides rupestris]|nr:hypothetical protein CRUP_010014 [Coryphaenoides rupestris]